MDAKARRLLWNDILSLIKENRIVILTSHSMEECEALCTRLVIMVNGHFKCLGSPQHLKTKFGSGYLLTVRLNNEEKKSSLLKFIKKYFPDSIVQDSHKNLFEFVLPFTSTKLSSIFNKLEKHRENLDLKDYSISQTTLDQIFINFAKQQNEDPFNEASVSQKNFADFDDMINVEKGHVGIDKSSISAVNYVRSESFNYEAQSRRGSTQSQEFVPAIKKPQNDVEKSLSRLKSSKSSSREISDHAEGKGAEKKSNRSKKGSRRSSSSSIQRTRPASENSRRGSQGSASIQISNSRRPSIDRDAVISSNDVLLIKDESSRKASTTSNRSDLKPLGMNFLKLVKI